MNDWTCPLCGEAGKRSREHVLPQWLGQLLVDKFTGGAPLEMSYRFTRFGEDEVIARSHQAARPEVVVRGVCERCNNGWMATLEYLAKPLLSPLVQGQPAKLDMAQQATIAHWAAKTVALIEQYEEESVVFDEGDLDQIRTAGAPAGFHVRLGYRPQFVEVFDMVASTAHVISRAEAEADAMAGREHPGRRPEQLPRHVCVRRTCHRRRWRTGHPAR